MVTWFLLHIKVPVWYRFVWQARQQSGYCGSLSFRFAGMKTTVVLLLWAELECNTKWANSHCSRYPRLNSFDRQGYIVLIVLYDYNTNNNINMILPCKLNCHCFQLTLLAAHVTSKFLITFALSILIREGTLSGICLCFLIQIDSLYKIFF